MRKIFFAIMGFFIGIQSSFAVGNAGVFQGSSVGADDMKKGNIHIEDIPSMIRAVIDFLMGIAGTVAVVFVIIGAYKILFSGFEGDKSQGKNTIIMALTGFAIASLAWFIIRLIIDNLISGPLA